LFETIEYGILNEDETKRQLEIYKKKGVEERLNLIINKRLNKKLTSKLFYILKISKNLKILINIKK
jgi:hypothetical protein